MNNFTEKPTWVEDYSLECKRHRKALKYSQLSFYIIIIFLLIFTIFLGIINPNFLFDIRFLFFFTIIIIMFISVIINIIVLTKYPLKLYEFLPSVIYEIGFLMQKNDNPKTEIYTEKINTLLGNLYFFIDKIEESIVGSFYAIDIRSYCKKLRTLTLLLNEYSKNYDQYSMDKYDISTQLIELANSIYKEKEDINKHTELIDLLIKDIHKENLQGKPIKIPLYDSSIKYITKILIMTPSYMKLAITAIFVLIFVFISIYITGRWINIEKDILFSTSVIAAVMIMVFVMSKKM